MKIAVVTDSTAYLEPEVAEQYGIKVVPIPFIIDNKVYNEGIDITTEEFYSKLKTTESFPSTSQPAIGELINLYTSLGNEGYDAVISIHLAGTISGLVQTIENIREQVTNIDVIPFDSKITVRLMGNLAIAAAKMAQAGKDVDEIISTLESLRSTIKEYFVVDDLQNLVRVGSVLKIKPILTFDDESDKIVAFDKVRSTKRALKRVEDLFEENIKDRSYPLRLIVFHANNEEMAMEWKAKLQEKYPDYPIDVSYFGPVIGTHLGEKALALGWMKDIEKLDF
ncbi:fatty acid-binding protein DegV [Ligilactobacillus salivarius]|uniref:DegV family protein n=1 Tax=Ligilactobacillus salivarius TaxID=1624 RepID=UPI0009DA965B|nr:DegV family protein [Ligilactobacillus salivarius]OQQ88524.1 fatty acid-binding protein DegV [Ligilactobacillus salivarius]